MEHCPVADLRAAGGQYSLHIDGHAPVELSPPTLAHLARQFVTVAHELREILEPPYVVGLVAQHNVDGDQRTPLYLEAWAFSTQEGAERFLELGLADVRQFDVQWPFDLSLPAVPELKFWWPKRSYDPDSALAEFRVTCFDHFLAEAGWPFWESLPLTQRVPMGRIWQTGEGLGGFDPAELELWVSGQKKLDEL